jgi:hypothetical protein
LVAWQHVQNPWYLIQPVALAHLVLLMFVPWYAPALIDYDYFFQRVVIEFMWMAMLEYTLLPVIGLSLFCWASIAWQWMRPWLIRVLEQRLVQ